jgi:hypothetical protein
VAVLATVAAALGLAAPAAAEVGKLKSISAGFGDFTCAIRSDDTPLCWGGTYDGQTTIPAGTGTVTQISAGNSHACAIKTGGAPVCWGRNDFGQASIPAGLGSVKDIEAGVDATCAVKTDGTPVCWGDDGDYGKTTIPDGTGTVKQVSIAGYNACAIKTDGTPVCWGYDQDGETTIPPGTGTVKQITVGTYYACALKTDNTPVCWGSGSSDEATVPDGIGTVTQIDAGYTHDCVVKTDGTPACWGNFDFGQTAVPADLGKVTQVSAGGYHSCAIKLDGDFECWGRRSSGQLRPRPPVVYVASPTPGLVLVQGARVLADYSCDDLSGTGLTRCKGTVPNGTPIDTSHPGMRTFTAIAVNGARRSASTTVHYRVLKPASIKETGSAKVFKRAGKLWVRTGLIAACPGEGLDCIGELRWRNQKPKSAVKSADIQLAGGESKKLEFPLDHARSKTLNHGGTIHLKINVTLSRGAGKVAHRKRLVSLKLG